MKLRSLILVVLAALCAFPAFAQDSATHSVVFDGFGFSYDSSLAATLNITEIPGDAPDVEQPGGPQVANTQFTLYYSQPPAPDNVFDTSATIRVFRTADFAGYDFASQELEALQTLLAERPDLTPYTETTVASQENSLPFMPTMPATQAFRARAQYLETADFSGISYITVYRQDVAPFLAHEFLYTFQGLSNDGSTYVSAVFWIFTDLFPAELEEDFDYEAFSAEYEQYVADTIATLNSASSENFVPSLTSLDAIVSSFSLAGSTPVDGVPATPEQPVPNATETPVADVGALEGNWMLVSYGSSESPIAPLETSPVTLSFGPEGVVGNAGCNQFGGSFQFENGTLTFSNLVSTLMACDEAIMAQETAIMDALATTTTFQVADGVLTINYDGGALIFNAV